MNALARTYAARGMKLLESALRQQPPPGVTAAYVDQFFGQFGKPLEDELARLLEQLAAPQSPPPSPVLNERLTPDEWPPAARTAANLAAVEIIASGKPIGETERTALLRYSGWGGLSLDAVVDALPPEWRPEARGLIHEYYTPSLVASEIARTLRPLIPSLPHEGDQVAALEPSAGIGRLVNALTGPGCESLHFTAVEYSHVSARLLAAVRPDLTVFEGPFERWIAENEEAVRGKLGLVVSNPPYGIHGASLTEDAHKAYRERKAYVYFLRRSLDLLAAGGIGVFLVPYGFLTGRAAAHQELRSRVLKRHHLMACVSAALAPVSRRKSGDRPLVLPRPRRPASRGAA